MADKVKPVRTVRSDHFGYSTPGDEKCYFGNDKRQMGQRLMRPAFALPQAS
jgi:hypothetical protein